MVGKPGTWIIYWLSDLYHAEYLFQHCKVSAPSNNACVRGKSMVAKFSHLVVLMLEDRSFDHMLGRLYHHDNPDPYHIIPRGQVFDGVSDTMFNTITLSPAPNQP